MKERPILFSAPMVRAILSGRKTVTRRLVSDKVPKGYEFDGYSPNGVRCSRPCGETGEKLLPCPYGSPGDRLWVRETFSTSALAIYPCPPCWFRADFGAFEDPAKDPHTHGDLGSGPRRGDCFACEAEREGPFRWRPSIHMPRRLSRITLEVVSVRVERLHEIAEEDAKREGVDNGPGLGPRLYPGTGAARGPLGHRAVFAELWDAINGKRAPWTENAWVWRVEFKRVQ